MARTPKSVATAADAMTARFGANQRFWPLRRRVRQLVFATRRLLFLRRQSGSELGLTVRAGRDALRRSWVPVLAAALVVGLLAWADPQLPAWVAALYLEDTWVADAVERKLGGGSYDALLTAIAGVGGVFIALYFTAVSNVVATVYASVPPGVRELIASDRYGNVYVRFISFLTALAVLLLAVRASGVDPYPLAAPVLAVLSALAIFAFAQLGRRTFYLADPSALAGVVCHDFQRWFGRAKADGWHRRDLSFQAHYHRRARSALGALAGLVDVAREREHLRGESLGRLVRHGLRLMTFHVASKPQVPTSSLWFGQRQTHRQWYSASSLEVGFAAITGGTLEPQTEPDWNWVEDGLLPKVIDAIEAELAAGRLDAALESLSSASPLWTAFGQTWSMAAARRWGNELTDACIAGLGEQQARESTAHSIAMRTGIADALGSLPVAAELGLFHSLRNFDTQSLRRHLAGLDWRDPKTPYALALPRQALVSVEAAQRSLEFERQAGTPHRTPGWYLAETALRDMASSLKSELDTAVSFARSWYVSTVDRFESAGRHHEAGAVLVRGLEATAKLTAHLNDLETFANNLEEGRLLDDTIWPSWDWQGLRSQLADLGWELSLRQARSIDPLAREPVIPDVPDFLGQAMHHTGELCVQALHGPQPEKFAQVFPLYFAGMFTIFERVREHAKELRPEIGAYWTAEPMLDLADISGHAMICAALHQKPELWDRCRECWERLIPATENLLPVVAASIASQSAGRMPPPRTMLRGGREQALERRLQEVVGLEDASLGVEDHEIGAPHGSPLIRLLCRDGLDLGSLLRPSDVFVVRYLMSLDAARDLEFGLDDWRVRELRELDDEAPPPPASDPPKDDPA